MRKGRKISLTIAAVLIVLGLIVSGLGFWGMGFNFRALNTEDVVSTSFEIAEPFREISVEADTADVYFQASEDGVCRVECMDFADRVYSVDTEAGVLRIVGKDERAWYTNELGETYIKVSLPEREYTALRVLSDTGDIEISKNFSFCNIEVSSDTGNVVCLASAENMLKISTDTGTISVDGISAGAMDFAVSAGAVTVSDVKVEGDVKVGVSTGETYLSELRCRNLVSDGNTGNISLKSVIAEEHISIERTTGDVTFDRSDAAEIFVQTNSGDVTGSVRSDKVFLIETDTGAVDVPKSVTGGSCEVITDTGSIKLRIDQ